MFVASLFLAGLQLIGAAIVYAVARTQRSLGLILALVGGLLAAFGVPSLLMFFSSAAFFQLVSLLVIGTACTLLKVRQRLFAAWGVATTVVIMGLVGWSGQHSWAALKEQYPFESLSARLAYENKSPTFGEVTAPSAQILATNLPAATLERLDEAEQFRRWSWTRRNDSIRLVHASYVEQFVASPGFGLGRMPLPSPYSIEHGDKRGQLTLPLDRRPDFDGSPEPDVARHAGGLTPDVTGPLGTLHDEARRDFLDSEAFGYFQDRDHIAGFVPHSFLENQPRLFAGESHQRWLTVRVELVSILKHERPMVYMSDHLPNMMELVKAPVREPDAFEQRALDSLFQGEDLVSDVQPERIRALGSLRAMRQCLECHDVQRGTLLGAFSYEFLRDPPVRQPKVDVDADRDELL